MGHGMLMPVPFSSSLLVAALVSPASGAGTVTIAPSQVTIETKVSFTYTYTVGEGGMAVGDGLRVEDPLFHGMRWTKWSLPQTDPTGCTAVARDQSASRSLVTASTTGPATLALARVDEQGAEASGADIHLRVFTEVTVTEGTLAPGDRLDLVFGDTTGGTPDDPSDDDPLCGHETPDRAFQRIEWRAWEQLGGKEWTQVPGTPTLDVLAEPEPVALWTLAPSEVVAGEPFDLRVVPVDRRGNAVLSWTGTVALEASLGGASHTFSPSDGGFHLFPITIGAIGVHRIQVSGGGLLGESNPVDVLDRAPERTLWWGDLHAHHGHSYVDDGGTIVDENHVYARDHAGLDFAAETQKALDTEIDGEALWAELQAGCTRDTVDGTFVVVLAFEWVGDPSGGRFYHHNVYWDDCEGRIGDHARVRELGGDHGLYAWIREAGATTGSRALLGPHATRYTGYDWDTQDQDLRRFVEVYSEWGNDMEPPNEDASVPTGIERGNRMGFLASSDNHDGWMGNPLSAHRTRSGLTGLWASSLTRADVWEALHDRHTYATTGSRILLRWAVEDGGIVREGEAYVAGAPVFRWDVHGTAPIETITVSAVRVGGTGEVLDLWTESPGLLDRRAGAFAWTDWDGSDVAVWLTVTQADGEKAWSSPVWLTLDCDGYEVLDPAGRCPGETAADSEPPPPDDSAPPADTATGPGRRCGCGVAGTAGTGWPLLALVVALVSRRRRPPGRAP